MGCVCVSILFALLKSRREVERCWAEDERDWMEARASRWKGRMVRSMLSRDAAARMRYVIGF